jgi:hypothetical protein
MKLFTNFHPLLHLKFPPPSLKRIYFARRDNICVKMTGENIINFPNQNRNTEKCHKNEANDIK